MFPDLWRLPRILASGYSSSGGFECEFTHRRLGLKAALRTSGHIDQLQDYEYLRRMVLPVTAGMCMFFAAFFLFHPAMPGVVAPTVLRMIFALSVGELVTVGCAGLFSRSTWQWHVCEHKVNMLMRREMAPTLENLRAVTPVSPFCGTVEIALFCGVLAALGLLVSYPRIAVPMGLSCASAISILGMFPMLPRRGHWHRLVAILGAPALGVAMGLERMCVLREPTEQQLRHTLTFVIATVCKHPWLLHPRLRRKLDTDGSLF